MIDKVRCIRRPRVYFQLHQPGRYIIGQPLIARSVRFSYDQLRNWIKGRHERLTLAERALCPHQQPTGIADGTRQLRCAPHHGLSPLWKA